MNEVSSLSHLIEKLEKATDGSRELDALIECEVRRFQAYAVGLNDKQRAHWKPVGTKGEVNDGPTRYHAPTFTLSMDAAMKLKPSGFTWAGGDLSDENVPWCCITCDETGDDYACLSAATFELALCIASLKAIERSNPPAEQSTTLPQQLTEN